ncbi:DNA translocase FtsK-like [Penaeus monodon]|uniref:DNA translocase FtsK-like n=1 Tax=Penaeus monodon TaxID=6687 RepID=UPI0018A6EC6D|nr:DNA translocase FtsK-like [Penaeus monodon]
MKMIVAFLILGCVASSRAIFFDLFKKESQQADPWPAQPADPWAQPVSAWAKPSFQPVIKEVPIYIPYPKLEPVPISKPVPIFKPEFVEAPIPVYKPQIGLPDKFFNFNANVGLQKQPQYYQQPQQPSYQQLHQQQPQEHRQPSTPSTAYQAPESHHHHH